MLDTTLIDAIEYDIDRLLDLEPDAELYLLGSTGEVVRHLIRADNGWYVEEDLESSDLTVRLFPVYGLTQADIGATVSVAYQKDDTLGFMLYGPMKRGEWKQAASREWKRVGAAIGRWEVPTVESGILLESGDGLLLESGDDLFLEAA